MKRLLLVLLAGFLINAYVFAQWDEDDSGDYDSEYDYDSGYDEQPVTGDSGTTNITVKNTGAENESEQKLKLPNSQPIYLYFYNNVQNPPAPEPAPQPQPVETPPPEPVYTPPLLIEEKYNPPPPPPPPPPVEYRYIPSPPVEYWYIPPPQVEYRYIPAPPAEPVYTPPPPNIRVIPALPDPNSPRIYRLQVGAYSVHSTADRIAQQLCAAGMQAGIEYYNSLLRVFVSGVRAADVASIVQTLGVLGFEEVWIRE